MRRLSARSIALLVGAAGVALILVSTPAGAGISPDSCHYLSMADNLVAGRGAFTSITRWGSAADHVPVHRWPPLFPACIAALHALGLGLEVAARLVVAASFGAAAGLVSLTAARVDELLTPDGDAGGAVRASALAGGLSLVWVTLSHTALWALSDATFLALEMLALYACVRALCARGGALVAWVAVATLGVTLAALTRYIGVALWGWLVLWCAWQAWRTRGPARVAWLAPPAVAAALVGAWLLRTLAATGTAAALPYGAGLSGRGHAALSVLRAVGSEFLPYPVPGRSWTLGLPFQWEYAAALVAWPALLFLGARAARNASRLRARGGRTDGVAAVLLLSAVYVLCLIAVIRAGPGGILPSRYAAPALAPLLVAGVALLRARPGSLPRSPPGSRRRRGELVARVLLGVWAAYLVTATSAAVWRANLALLVGGDRHPFRGLGYESPEFLARPSSRFLRTVSPERVYTNCIVTWYLTRRPTRYLPDSGDARGLAELGRGDPGALLVVYSAETMASPVMPRVDRLREVGALQGWIPFASYEYCEIFLSAH